MQHSSIVRRIHIGVLSAALVALVGCGSSSSQAGKKAGDESAEAQKGETSQGITDCTSLRSDDGGDDSESQDERAQPRLPLKAAGPVATVGDEEISAEAFNRFAMKRTPPGRHRIPKPLADQLKKQYVRTLVRLEIAERRMADADVTVEKAEIERAFLAFQDRFPSDQAYRRFLEQNAKRGITEDDIRVDMCKDLMLRTYIDSEYDISVTDEEVKAYFEEHESEFEKPGKVKASHILIKVGRDAPKDEVEEAKKRTDDIAKKARAEGADFAELARKHSEGPTAKKGGLLGYFSKNRMVPAFSQAAFAMEPGEVSKPVRTKFGFHVIKVHDKKSAQAPKLADAEKVIRRKLTRKKFKKARGRLIQDAEKELEIEFHLDNIEAGGPDAASPKDNALPPRP